MVLNPQITTSKFVSVQSQSHVVLETIFPLPVGCEDTVALKPTNAFGCTRLHIREPMLFVLIFYS